MTTSSTITAKNFSTKLAAWKRSAGSLRDSAQAIIMFGFAAYRDHGDAGALSRMMAAAVDAKGVNAKRMDDYIRAHANVRWDDKSGAYRKAKKGAAAEVTAPDVPWYEFEKPAAGPRAYDINRALDAIRATIEKGDRDVKVSPIEARKLLDEIRSLVDTLETDAEIASELQRADEAA
jgi:hypothetical protein